LDGVAVEGAPPTLFFKLDPLSAPVVTRLICVAYGWEGVFGAALTVTMMMEATHARVFLPARHPALVGMRSGRFVAAMMWKDQLVAAFDVDCSVASGAMAFDLQWERVQRHVPYLADVRANYWETLGFMNFLERLMTSEDRLSVGWARQYSRRVRALAECIIDEDKANGHPLPAPTGPVSSFLEPFVEAARSPSLSAAILLEALGRLQTQGDAAVVSLMRSQGEYLDLSHSLSGHSHCGLFDMTLQTHLLSTSVTDAGRSVSWFDSEGATLGRLRLTPSEFPEWFSPELYWPRMPRMPPTNLGRLVGPSDVPIDLGVDAPAWSTFPLAEKAEEVSASAEALIEEAQTHKTNCIPNGAVLQLAVGPFLYLEAWERRRSVDFVCRSPKGEFALAQLDVTDGSMNFDLFWNRPQGEESDRMEAALKLLLAATVRDFFVVEERERVFDAKKTTRALPGERRRREGPVTIYLPRVKYRSPPDLARCAAELNQAERRSHFVGAHLRKAASASEHQLFLAARYGIEVPTGFTFVRPHERGQKGRQIIYRSRSALRSLYQVDPAADGAPKQVEWFAFERDVQGLMKALGFTVEHVAASRSGDEGVDLLASKGADLDESRWIIQCKCYAPKNKVGPSVIRELVGTLKAQSAGTRGMVVTTSTFTSGARELAQSEGIRLMDGAEFAARLQGRV
jgi:hypothetical protein